MRALPRTLHTRAHLIHSRKMRTRDCVQLELGSRVQKHPSTRYDGRQRQAIRGTKHHQGRVWPHMCGTQDGHACSVHGHARAAYSTSFSGLTST